MPITYMAEPKVKNVDVYEPPLVRYAAPAGTLKVGSIIEFDGIASIFSSPLTTSRAT